MELYLVQHGESKSKEVDPERSLTDEGRRGVERMAEFLRPLDLQLDRIEHSDKLRARQTAEILAACLKPARGTKEVPGLAPNDNVEPVRQRLEQESSNVMLVGHLPFLSKLASRLLGVEAEKTTVRFQYGGVVRLERDGSGRWGVGWMLVPPVLPKLAD